jgi:phosphohistidine phosphatase SixA
MRITNFFVLLFAIVIVSNGCKDDPKNEAVISTFYFIRHAEKDRTDPENADPELNQDGLGRAIRWAEVFDPIALTAIYSTNYERTTMTAEPTSVKKEIDVQFYDPKNMDVESFMNNNLGGEVLIVGHSNSTPELVNRFIGEEKYPSMDDSDNSSLFIVRIIDGVPTDIRLKMD